MDVFLYHDFGLIKVFPMTLGTAPICDARRRFATPQLQRYRSPFAFMILQLVKRGKRHRWYLPQEALGLAFVSVLAPGGDYCLGMREIREVLVIQSLIAEHPD